MTVMSPRRPQTQAGDYLRLSAQNHPNRECFVFGDGSSRSFAEVNGRVNRLAHALAAHGLVKGSRVAILAIDSGEYAEVLFACMKLGATYVPLNNRLRDGEVLTLLRRAEPVAIFASSRYVPLVERLLLDLTGVRLASCFDATELTPYDQLLAQGEDVEPDVEVFDEDILGLAFTSGTTGLPKGVLQSQRMVKALVINMSIDYEILPEEFRYTASPTFHIAGQSMIFMHVMRGFATLILPQFEVGAVLKWMQSGRLTGCFLVPTMIIRLLEDPRVHDGTYEGLLSIIYGASPMTAGLLRRAMGTFGCNFMNAFGASTEGGLQSILSSADHRRALDGKEYLLGSIGKPAFGVDLRIVDADGVDVARGEVGEIITRSDPVMSGYLEMPEETTRAVRDGWFWAGDLGRLDENGYLYIAGRSKDMLIRGGENIYPVEIEAVLVEHPDVLDVAVVGKPDDVWGETVVAFVTAEPGHRIDINDLRTLCREKLAAFKVPETYEVVTDMPVNASGKILKRELREQIAQRSDAAGSHDLHDALGFSHFDLKKSE